MKRKLILIFYFLCIHGLCLNVYSNNCYLAPDSTLAQFAHEKNLWQHLDFALKNGQLYKARELLLEIEHEKWSLAYRKTKFKSILDGIQGEYVGWNFDQQDKILKLLDSLLTEFIDYEKEIIEFYSGVFNGPLYERLLKKLLNEKQYINAKAIADFYQSNPAQDHRLRSLKVAKKLFRLPFIHQIYGVGFPYYGEVDMRVMNFFKLVQVLNQKLSPEEFVNHILIDLDFLIVIKFFDPRERIQQIVPTMSAVMMNYFINEAASYRRMLSTVFKDLYDNEGIADRNLEPLDQFVNDGRFHVDLISFNLEIWQLMPIFIDKEDLKYFKWIRDIEFTSNFIDSNLEISNLVPLFFRRNRIMKILADQHLSEDELIDVFIGQMVHRRFIYAMPKTRQVIVDRLQAAIQQGFKDQMIQKTKDRKIQLTVRGQWHLQYIAQLKAQVLLDGINQSTVYDPNFSSFMAQDLQIAA